MTSEKSSIKVQLLLFNQNNVVAKQNNVVAKHKNGH